MILSNKHKFIFIKGKKVAGTSIELLLSNYCGSQDIITPISPIDEINRLQSSPYSAQNFSKNKKTQIQYLTKLNNSNNDNLQYINIPKSRYYNHMPLSEVLTFQPQISKDWHIFAFERNPYSKIISYANMQLKYKDYIKDGSPMISCLDNIKQQIDLNFKNETITDVRNIQLYKDKNDKLVTNIYYFEDLNSEINKLFMHLKIDDKPKLEHLKKGISSNSIHPKNVFSRPQLLIINKLFEEEFDTFNYHRV